jgi:hypothetical protein
MQTGFTYCYNSYIISKNKFGDIMIQTIFVTALVAAIGFSTPSFAKGSAGHGGGHSGSNSYSSSSTHADHSVSSYVRSNGTYVGPSHATNPNSTRNDNYSTKGNVNPYTGKEGTKPTDY